MEDAGLFIAGLAVTLAVVGALAFIVWAAVQDGRRESVSAIERIPHGPAPASAGADPVPARAPREATGERRPGAARH